jgi:transposase
MGKYILTDSQKADLELRHSESIHGKERDRIKAVLLRSEGWSMKQIAQALRMHESSVSRHLNDYKQHEKLKNNSGGSQSRLNAEETQQLIAHLIEQTYHHQKDIVAYIELTFGEKYAVSGLHKWLTRNGFSYKQPKGIPGKLDAEKQQEFIDKYQQLKESLPDDEGIYFMDSVHPTQATKLSCGWIKRGTDKHIKTTASRTRVNVVGAIRLGALSKTISQTYERINQDSIVDFMDLIREQSEVKGTLHLVIDQAGYHKAFSVRDKAKALNIKLHFLPPYSPNLNPIERLWKVMNEQVRNNRHFDSAQEFRQKINYFLKEIIPDIGSSLESRINDNFQVIKPAF